MLAGQSHYQTLLDAGVQLHEFQGAVLHAKTVVVDGVWSTVGSSNLDYRSFTGNNEINLVVLGEDFGALMQRQFDADVAASRPVTAGSLGAAAAGPTLEGTGRTAARAAVVKAASTGACAFVRSPAQAAMPTVNPSVAGTRRHRRQPATGSRRQRPLKLMEKLP